MKRFHVHVAVPNLEQSMRFYSAMFGAPPSVVKPDYAKWMLDDPRINFAISSRQSVTGVNHLGIQAESEAELVEIHGRLEDAGAAIAEEQDAQCCYANSNKYWVQDPSGIAWESFHTLGSIPFFGEADAVTSASSSANSEPSGAAVCCPPRMTSKPIPIQVTAKGCCNV
ncbi:MAG: ArsI/CadI family heavy metal resistance metalloenzyme [Burkholderiales bacterium]